MTDDLKNYRAPRRPWPWILGAGLIVAMTCVVGPMDFADRLAMDAEIKVMRAELAALKRPRAEIAPIRPWRRCGEKPFIARQADGGRWLIRCAPSADLTRVKL